MTKPDINDMKNAISKLKNNKTARPDGIAPKLLKYRGDTVATNT